MKTTLLSPRAPSRLHTALLFSLLAHALLLSITLGGQAFGLPGLAFPWKERRLEDNDLRILLAPAQPAPAALAPAPADALLTATAKPALTPVDQPAVASDLASMTPPAPAVERSEVAAVPVTPPAPAPTPATNAAPPSEPVMTATKRPDVELPIAPEAPPVRAPVGPVARHAPGTAVDAAQKQIDQDMQDRALAQARLERDKQAAEQLRQTELTAAAQREAARQEQLRRDAARADETARGEAARLQAERQEIARQEASRQERARQDEKAQQEATRQNRERAEVARLDAARKEAARQDQAMQAQLEAARQAQLNKARQDSLQQEAARQDGIRQEAARQEAITQETARQNAIKQEAARQVAIAQESARQEAIRQEAAKQEPARQAQRERAEQEAKREERLRAIGQQLNAEAALRGAPVNRPPNTLPLTAGSLRRGWLFGRADLNADLVLYAEAMSRKIEMNMTFDMVREAVKQPHAQPIVTVAVRADGSVEKVTFVVSSGVAAIDEAIRKVVASQAPYSTFTPALARQYDVIEIRRTWIFDMAIRLQ